VAAVVKAVVVEVEEDVVVAVDVAEDAVVVKVNNSL
jgi:hypothetical protein